MINRRPNQVLKEALATWATSEASFDHAVTLTAPEEYSDREHASLVVRFFMNRINRALLKHRYKRHNESVAVFPTIECKNKRIHVHAAMRCPDHVCPTEFARAIERCWKAANKGARFAIVDVQPMRDSGWIEYICKETAPGNIDAIDVENISWGTRRPRKHHC
jgi:hypothetical protein